MLYNVRIKPFTLRKTYTTIAIAYRTEPHRHTAAHILYSKRAGGNKDGGVCRWCDSVLDMGGGEVARGGDDGGVVRIWFEVGIL